MMVECSSCQGSKKMMVWSQCFWSLEYMVDVCIGSFWTETFFNEGGWGSSLRSLLPWPGSNTIRYGNIKLEQTTATSLAFSPDNSYLFAISLNHTIKAWNLSNGRIDVNKDLLNEE